MNTSNIITTATTSESVNPKPQATKASSLNNNRLLRAEPQASPLRGWAVLTLCALALGAVNVMADQESTAQDSTLVAGTMQSDPRIRDDQHFVLAPSPGVSPASGNYEERARYTIQPVNGTSSTSTVVTGFTVQTYRNGDQLYLYLRGTMNISKQSAGTYATPAAIQGNVSVLGGTGKYAGAYGQGFAMGMLASEGKLSLRTDLTVTTSSSRNDK